MANIIKLENIKDAGFSPTTGKQVGKVTEEYTCESCRHLVDKGNVFCWQCGEKLEPSVLVEHYYKGDKLSNAKFKEMIESES